MKILVIALLVLAAPVIAIVLMGLNLPQTHVASRSVSFPTHPQAEVWNLISGPPDWRPEVQRFEALPDRDGHRMWREHGSHGRSIAYELVASEPPRKMVVRIAEPKLPYGGTWTYELEPEAQGSRLTVTEAGEVYNPIFRFVSRYVMGHTATIDAYFKALSGKLK
jgi:hypothetical protein